MRIAKNFVLQEFVSHETWRRFGTNSIWFIDPKIVAICQFLRNKFAVKITINDWHLGGNYFESGFRDSLSTVGSKFSQHRFGRAADIKVKGLNSNLVRKFIIEDYKELNKLGLTSIEIDTETWVHIDTRFTNKNELFTFNP